MDWFKGKSTGNNRSYHSIWGYMGFCCKFSLKPIHCYRFSVGKTLSIWLPGRSRWRFVGALWWKQLSGAAVLAGRNLVRSLWEISSKSPWKSTILSFSYGEIHHSPFLLVYPLVMSTVCELESGPVEIVDYSGFTH